MRKLIFFGLALLLSGSAIAYTQEAPKTPPAQRETASKEIYPFQLKFRVLELEEGKVINSRDYSMNLTTTPNAFQSIRSNERIPFPTSPISPGTNMANVQFQYIDSGIKIDCRDASMMNNSLLVNITGEIDTVAPEEKPNQLGPIIQNRRIASSVLLPNGKPTIIFSSDDFHSKRVMQLEVTAVKLSQ